VRRWVVYDGLVDDFLRQFSKQVMRWDTDAPKEIERRLVSEVALCPHFLSMAEGWFWAKSDTDAAMRSRNRLAERLAKSCREGLSIQNPALPN
jgi:hypothetical protein